MGLIHKIVLGVNVTINSKEKILEYIEKYLRIKNQESRIKNNKSIKPLIIFTPNPEIISYAQKNEKFKQIVNSAQINLPDGAGTVWAIKKLYNLQIKRLSGTDFTLELCRLAADMGFTVGLIGGKDGVALEALECLQNTYAKLSGWAIEGPDIKISKSKIQITNQIQKPNYKNPEDTSDGGRLKLSESHDSSEVEESEKKYILSLTNKIFKSKTSIVFVGLGFPKQEYFISILNSYFLIHNSSRRLVLMAVGGAFDYISGRVPRAPDWMRERGWEWLYRLIREPWRIKRQLMGARFYFDLFRHGS